MKAKIASSALFTIVASLSYAAMPPPAEVERVLEGKIIQDDFVNEEEPVDVPLRYRDSLKK